MPISVIFHSGDMHSGHLQAAVLAADGWYKCDDGRVALRDDQDFRAELKNITFVYLCLVDKGRCSGPCFNPFTALLEK